MLCDFYLWLEGKQKNKIIMYHGTTYDVLNSILSFGLIPNPKKRVFDKHDGSFHIPSIKSYEGIYLTTNLNKAIAASGLASYRKNTKHHNIFVIVVVEVVPSMLKADEDAIIIRNVAPNDYIAISLFCELLKGKHTRVLTSYYNEFINKNFEKIKEDYFQNMEMHPQLEKRIIQILDELFYATIVRQMAYVTDQYTPQEIKYMCKRNHGVDNESDIVLPDKQEAEEEYARIFKKLTSIIKPNYHLETSKSARIDEPIYFFGKNKIISIMTIKLIDRKYYVDVIYGKLPQETKQELPKILGPIVIND